MGMHRAGVTKRFLPLAEHGEEAKLCYFEKGSQRSGQPSLVFIHGFSSNKRTWLPVIRYISEQHHCIAVDLPNHGDSVGFSERFSFAENMLDLLKEFVDPICLVGASMGGSLVAMFVRKYPLDIGMVGLLSPPPGEAYETAMLHELRAGTYHLILPESFEQLRAAIQSLSTKKVHLTRPLARNYLKTHRRTVEQHKRILQIAFERDYPNLAEIYGELRSLTSPTLILWGRDDQLCHPDGATYLKKLLPNSDLLVLDDCGHLISTDKPEETATGLTDFLLRHPYQQSRL